MCGIVGILNLDDSVVDLSSLADATHIQRHRGPDDEGYLLVNTRLNRAVSCGHADTDPRLHLPRLEQFWSERFNLAFGFRRLSIQDLSPAGHQPMSTADGRFWIVFNGEIYNYLELRAELIGLGHQFHTATDTEVILAAYQQWGEVCLNRLNGMWAFVIWDAYANSLFAARDRFGEKPFHYIYVPGKVFAFASEIKALWSLGIIHRSIHEETLSLFKQHRQLDCGEQTFYQGVLRLPQAHYLKINVDGVLQKRRYWDIDLRNQENGRQESCYREGFRELFYDSVKLRLRADVPLGSSLSGGLDSSTVVCVMNELLPAGAVQKTFSARFEDPTKDEGKWIERIIEATGVKHFSVWPRGEEMFGELAKVFWHQDEPFSSTSIYAQWCVMRLAKEQGVIVLLDGQGADEMLAGYHSYFQVVADDLLRRISIPSYVEWRRDYRNLHRKPLQSLGIGGLLKENIPGSVKRPVKALLRMSNGLPRANHFSPIYPEEFGKSSALRKMLWWHTTREGLVSLLRYADRNSMAHSREVRMPFLDHRLVEFVFKLPDKLLLRNGWTKWILRNSFQGIVPDEISFRVDKIGFETPEERWLGRLKWPDIMLESLKNNLEARSHSMSQLMILWAGVNYVL